MPDRASAQLVIRPKRPPCGPVTPPPPGGSIFLTPVSATGRGGTVSTSVPPVGLNGVKSTANSGGLITFSNGGWSLALVKAAAVTGVANAIPVHLMNAFAGDTAVGNVGLVQLPGGTQLLLAQNSGIGTTGIVRILTQTLTGVQAAGATGTVIGGTPPLTLAQSSAAGTLGTPAVGFALARTGVSASGAVGNALPPSGRVLTQAGGTGATGALGLGSPPSTLTNDSGVGTVGTFSPTAITGDLIVTVSGVNVFTVTSVQVVTVNQFAPGTGSYVLSCPATAVQTGSVNTPVVTQSRVAGLVSNVAVGVNGGIATVGGGNNVLSANQATGDVGSVQTPFIANVANLTMVQAAAQTGLSFVMGIPGADVLTISGSFVITIAGSQVDTVGAGSAGTPLTTNRGTGKTGQVIASYPGQGTFALTGVSGEGDVLGNVIPELPRTGADVTTISGSNVTTIAAVQVDTN